LLGVFYWIGLEQAYVPADFSRLHYLRFSFPYSHGLLASFLWSAAALLAKYFWRNHNGTKIGTIIGLAVFSHFTLDLIVHDRELPATGRESAKLGFGLWNHMAAACALKMMLVVVALALDFPVASKGFKGRAGVSILMVVLSALTVVAMTTSTPPHLTTAATWVLPRLYWAVSRFGWIRPNSLNIAFEWHN